MGRPWARSDPGCAKQRARIAHCLMLRLRRWVRACAHDPVHAQGKTGKPNTVIAFRVHQSGRSAAYEHNMSQGERKELTAQSLSHERATPLKSPSHGDRVREIHSFPRF